MFNENEINQKENEACKAKSSPPAAAASATVPPPLSPSPSHEFSFTISLNHQNCTSAPYQPDLVPADDIFFHGHLLPLEKLQITEPGEGYDTSSNIKSKHKPSFSYLLGLTKWLRRNDDEKGESKKKKNKKEKSLDLRCCWQKVGPSVSFKWEKEKGDLRRRPCSFSGKANDSREGSARWRWRGEFSAPSSMWTSPTNSGINVASSIATTAASDESTMVELQNAVQAAIAHCKNSIAVKEEIFS
ncbi:hypothetical protein IEQ34_018724 [Dendrobium chrysotoxum]|uniref:BRI1 kinase inhibitor 1 n=1 Tax=Dendrobium chrysotoxum TaxID=161865 RepID=A0AAV7FP55_DENCH|nr:hypothetical protein IEQ34_018724 [Dendrobium chrysotoxum]